MGQNYKPALGESEVTIGGQTFILRFSLKAMAALQDHFELPSMNAVGEHLQQAGDRLGPDDIVAVFWSGLRTHHPEITKEAAFDLLDDVGLQGLDGVMQKAFAGALPADDGSAAGEGGGESTAGPRKTGRSTKRSKKARRSG